MAINNTFFYLATISFALAVLHTFSVKLFQHLAGKYPEGSIAENFFHLLGEIEIIFGLWAGIFLLIAGAFIDKSEALEYLQNRNFTEPAFVFVVMVISSTKPILRLTEALIRFTSKLLPFSQGVSFYLTALIVGPLLGSFITEPAAMTVTAFLLLKNLFEKDVSMQLKYATLALLFVNISIGGTLTPYAAPPIVMVAAKWNWDIVFMLQNFGWKSFIAVLISTAGSAYIYRNELNKIKLQAQEEAAVPFWITLTHLFFLMTVVISAHYMAAFILIFLFFLGLTAVTKEYQEELKIREGLLVGFFLAGLVILGGPQKWWLEPLILKLESLPLFLSAVGLTAITDNAALTYLGSLVPNMSEMSKYALVAGSVVGGGLTVIANAPNPAGYGILNSSFGSEGISAVQLFRYALIPTAVAGVCLWLL